MIAVVSIEDLRAIVREELGRTAQGHGIVDLAKLPPSLKRHAYAAARAGELPAAKVGKRWYARQRDLDGWLFLDKGEGESDADRVARWVQ